MGDSHFLHTCILDNLTNLEMLFVHLQKVVDEYTLAGLLAHLFFCPVTLLQSFFLFVHAQLTY